MAWWLPSVQAFVNAFLLCLQRTSGAQCLEATVSLFRYAAPTTTMAATTTRTRKELLQQECGYCVGQMGRRSRKTVNSPTFSSVNGVLL
jgi:hypothetical protein